MNFRPAERFGDLIVCIDGKVEHSELPQAAARLRTALQQITARDFLIPCGHPSLIALAGALMLERVGKVRTLIWQGSEKKYVAIEFGAGGAPPGAALERAQRPVMMGTLCGSGVA
jgi:hypothetical protein